MAPPASGFPTDLGLLHGNAAESGEERKRTKLGFASSFHDFSVYHQLHDADGDADFSSRALIPSTPLQQENFTSSFSKEKAPQGSGRSSSKWLRVVYVFLCLVLLACICFGVSVLFFNGSSSSKFYVVIDCGSTGNRVYVYRASVNHENGDVLPISLKSLPESFERRSSGRAYNRMETEPGLDKLVNDVARLKKALKPLVKWAEKQIPAKSHENTSLFLYATAGVRRLPRSDSDWLLHNSLSVLKSSRFSCKPEWIKIITGVEEAYYGWIALNYHTGVLGSVPKRETFGALDLGGSSLQVTFEGNADKETSLNLSIGAVKHRVSAYSLASYGLNDAFDKSVGRIFRTLPDVGNADLSKGKGVEVNHPCLHSGYEAEYSCALCGSILQKNETRQGDNKRVSVHLVGSPNWEKCVELAEAAVNTSEWSDRSPAVDCKLHPCALDGHLPRPTGRFYVMSGFYVVYRFFNLTSDASLDAVLEKGREFCGKPWDAARSSVVPQPFVEQYCFRAPYAVLLLREGLQMSDSEISVGSGSVTWTIGVALFEAGKAFPYGRSVDIYRTLRASVEMHTVLIVFFASLFVLAAAVSCSSGGWGFPKSAKKSYLPFFKHNNNAAASSSSSVLNIPAPFRFQWWSSIHAGDGRVKMPLSPVSNVSNRIFDTGLGIQARADPQSYSSGSLIQLQNDDRNPASFWTPPHRSKMQLQSRRSQSREDLSSSLSEVHLQKV